MWYLFHFQKIPHQIKLDGALFYADPADFKETDKFLRIKIKAEKKETWYVSRRKTTLDSA